jgi:hypothetical protein
MALLNKYMEYVFYSNNSMFKVIKDECYFDPIKLKDINTTGEHNLLTRIEFCHKIKKIMKKFNNENYFKKIYIELIFRKVNRMTNNLKWYIISIRDKYMLFTAFDNICGCGYTYIVKKIIDDISPIETSELHNALESACFYKQIDIIKLLLTQLKVKSDEEYYRETHYDNIARLINENGSIKIGKFLINNCVGVEFNYFNRCLEGDNSAFPFPNDVHYACTINHYCSLIEQIFISGNFKYIKWVITNFIKNWKSSVANPSYENTYVRICEVALFFCRKIRIIKWLMNKFSSEAIKYCGISKYDKNDMSTTLSHNIQTYTLRYNLLKNIVNRGNIYSLLENTVKYYNYKSTKFIIKIYNNFGEFLNINDIEKNINQLTYLDTIRLYKLLISKCNIRAEDLFSISYRKGDTNVYMWLHKKYNFSQEIINNLYYKHIDNNGIINFLNANRSNLENQFWIKNVQDLTVNIDQKKIKKIIYEIIDNRPDTLSIATLWGLYLSKKINFIYFAKFIDKLMLRVSYTIMGLNHCNLHEVCTIQEIKLLNFLMYKGRNKIEQISAERINAERIKAEKIKAERIAERINANQNENSSYYNNNYIYHNPNVDSYSDSDSDDRDSIHDNYW